MTHTTSTLLAINTAVRAADGWYDATKSACARFCTESLVDAGESCLAGMTVAERTKFASTISGEFERHDREWALLALCAYAHAMRLREWGAQFERSVAAARAEFPAAYEQLGAVL